MIRKYFNDIYYDAKGTPTKLLGIITEDKVPSKYKIKGTSILNVIDWDYDFDGQLATKVQITNKSSDVFIKSFFEEILRPYLSFRFEIYSCDQFGYMESKIARLYVDFNGPIDMGVYFKLMY